MKKTEYKNMVTNYFYRASRQDHDKQINIYRYNPKYENNNKTTNCNANEFVIHQINASQKISLLNPEKHIEIHYQLQFDLNTFLPVGIEALLRWRDTNEKLMYPNEIIPIAKDLGLMDEITQWVICQACRDNAWLIELGILDVPIAVNVSPESFLIHDFHELIEETLHFTGLPPARLELEVIEDISIQESVITNYNLQAIRALGVGLSIDDFGTGYASLFRLKKLESDKIKIDRSFISGVLNHEVDREIVRSMVNLSNALKLPIVAEGIETVEQLEFLKSVGCKLGQGYLYAPPLPVNELIIKIDSIYQTLE